MFQLQFFTLRHAGAVLCVLFGLLCQRPSPAGCRPAGGLAPTILRPLLRPLVHAVTGDAISGCQPLVHFQILGDAPVGPCGGLEAAWAQTREQREVAIEVPGGTPNPTIRRLRCQTSRRHPQPLRAPRQERSHYGSPCDTDPRGATTVRPRVGGIRPDCLTQRQPHQRGLDCCLSG